MFKSCFFQVRKAEVCDADKQAVVCSNASPAFPPVVQAVLRKDWSIETYSCEERTCPVAVPPVDSSSGRVHVSKSVLVQCGFLFWCSGPFALFYVLRFRIPKTFFWCFVERTVFNFIFYHS